MKNKRKRGRPVTNPTKVVRVPLKWLTEFYGWLESMKESSGSQKD